jgi:ribonuclease P/MRP protein subunit POP3
VPENIQNTLLARLVHALHGVSEFHKHRSLRNKRKRRAKLDSQNKKQKLTKDPGGAEQVMGTATAPTHQGVNVDDSLLEAPAILQHVVIGINSITRRLEAQASTRFSTLEKQSEEKPLRYVFVCRMDIDPPMLVDHLPRLVASVNSASPPKPTILIPLPKGAEDIIASIMGQRRVSALALDVSSFDQH